MKKKYEEATTRANKAERKFTGANNKLETAAVTKE